MTEPIVIAEPEELDAQAKLTLLRKLISDTLGSLDASDPAHDGDLEYITDYGRGWYEAARRVKSRLAWEPLPTAKQHLCDMTADRMGKIPGGPTTGWLGALWDAAYAEGERNATAKLVVRLMSE